MAAVKTRMAGLLQYLLNGGDRAQAVVIVDAVTGDPVSAGGGGGGGGDASAANQLAGNASLASLDSKTPSIGAWPTYVAQISGNTTLNTISTTLTSLNGKFSMLGARPSSGSLSVTPATDAAFAVQPAAGATFAVQPPQIGVITTKFDPGAFISSPPMDLGMGRLARLDFPDRWELDAPLSFSVSIDGSQWMQLYDENGNVVQIKPGIGLRSIRLPLHDFLGIRYLRLISGGPLNPQYQPNLVNIYCTVVY